MSQLNDVFQNECLKKIVGFWRRVLVSLTYLADWHSHPMYLPRPSDLDRKSCAEILSDPIHSYLRGLPLLLITFRSDDDPIHVPLWITLRDSGLSVEDSEIENVASEDPRIVSLLKGIPTCRSRG